MSNHALQGLDDLFDVLLWNSRGINFQNKLGVAVVGASVGGYDQRTSPSGIIAVVSRESVLGFQNSNHFLPVKLSGG